MKAWWISRACSMGAKFTCAGNSENSASGTGTESTRALRGASLWTTPSPKNRRPAARSFSKKPSSIAAPRKAERSEEHTSELQSLAYLVCRLLLEKKKKKNKTSLLCMEVHLTHTKQ